MAAHNEMGKAGETAACEHLRRKGYIIRHTNWRSGKKELDIIAEWKDRIVFIEVKSRRTDYYGHPEEAVDNKKIRNSIYAAQAYINQFSITKEYQFDIISIIGTPDDFTLNHLEDAFIPRIKR